MPFLKGYIPLRVHDRPLDSVRPNLFQCGGGLVRLSLGAPFGIEVGNEQDARTIRTARIDSIVMGPPEVIDQGWTVEFEGKSPLSPADEGYFLEIIDLYARYVKNEPLRNR